MVNTHESIYLLVKFLSMTFLELSIRFSIDVAEIRLRKFLDTSNVLRFDEPCSLETAFKMVKRKRPLSDLVPTTLTTERRATAFVRSFTARELARQLFAYLSTCHLGLTP